MSTNGQRQPEAIQADIERTRADLEQTLGAIERRLNPSELVDQGLSYLRHSGAREYVDNLGTAAKQDPIPLALVGVGLTWLMLSNGRGNAPAAATATDSDPGSANLKQKAALATQRLSQTAHAAGERARLAGASARHQVDRVRSGYEYLLHEQPLALGAIGLALGIVLAGVAPRTREEEALMGDASDRRQADLRDAGRDQLDKVRQTAQDAENAAGDSQRHDDRDNNPPMTARPAVDLGTP